MIAPLNKTRMNTNKKAYPWKYVTIKVSENRGPRISTKIIGMAIRTFLMDGSGSEAFPSRR